MEAYASKRDVYGIPIITTGIRKGRDDASEEEVARNRIWRKEHQKLREMTENLRGRHHTADFLEKWIFRKILNTDQEIEDMSRTVNDEIEYLETRRQNTLNQVKKLLDLQRSLARYRIGPYTDHVLDVQTPRWLLRAFHDKSYCRYDREIGILSSGYKSSNPGLSFDDLVKTLGLSETSLRNHCGGSNPTDR